MSQVDTSYIHRFKDASSTFITKVLAPEMERIEHAFEKLPALLRASTPLERIAKETNLSLTELRFGGWESLDRYIRDLENQITVLRGELELQNKNMRDLVLHVEEVAQNVIKKYREVSHRSPNE